MFGLSNSFFFPRKRKVEIQKEMNHCDFSQKKNLKFRNDWIVQFILSFPEKENLKFRKK
jgi:hypothetical protein